MKTLKSHQHSMQNDTEQSPPLNQCRAVFSADSEFSYSRLCLPHSHSLSSAFIWLLRFFPLPFCQASGFRNASGQSIKGRQHCGYLRAVLEGRACLPQSIPGLSMEKVHWSYTHQVSVLVDCVTCGLLIETAMHEWLGLTLYQNQRKPCLCFVSSLHF